MGGARQHPIFVFMCVSILFVLYGMYTNGPFICNVFNATLPSVTRQTQAKPTVENETARGIITNDYHVRDCISGSVLRRREGATVHRFVITLNNSKETTERRQKSFRTIYRAHLWGSHADDYVDKQLKSVLGSGLGSTLNWAQEAMAVLHRLINELKRMTNKEKIKILDIPCGDFQWMYRFLQQRMDVLYTGMDIVPRLIENHSRAFKGNPDWRFVNADVVVTPLKEQYDLVICRMMLQHLTTSDVMKVLKNIGDSGSKYLFTTTHSTQKNNDDLHVLVDTRYRPLNMELPPFSLGPPVCISRDGPKGASMGHYLGLWKLPLRQLSKCNLHMIKRKEPLVEDIWVC